MDSVHLEKYLSQEGLGTWRLRNLIMTIRSLRVAAFNPRDGVTASMEVAFVRRWAVANQ